MGSSQIILAELATVFYFITCGFVYRAYVLAEEKTQVFFEAYLNAITAVDETSLDHRDARGFPSILSRFLVRIQLYTFGGRARGLCKCRCRRCTRLKFQVYPELRAILQTRPFMLSVVGNRYWTPTVIVTAVLWPCLVRQKYNKHFLKIAPTAASISYILHRLRRLRGAMSEKSRQQHIMFLRALFAHASACMKNEKIRPRSLCFSSSVRQQFSCTAF